LLFVSVSTLSLVWLSVWLSVPALSLVWLSVWLLLFVSVLTLALNLTLNLLFPYSNPNTLFASLIPR
jgi:hypothetical protein